MKKTLTLLMLLSAAALFGAFGDPGIDRVVKIDRSRQLVLAENGKSNSVIVLLKDASPTAKVAAKELQTFLKEATNADFPIVDAVDPAKVSIVVGCKKDIAKLPRDGFIIKATGNVIVIAGKDDPRDVPGGRGAWGDYSERATLFGVYDFLERFVGAVFVFPGEGGTVIPAHKVLKVPAMDIVERPDNICRSVSWSSGEWYDSRVDIARERKFNNYRNRMQTAYIPNCHGLGRMAYIERFGKTHPEYFAMRKDGSRSNSLAERMGGQLCFSSNIVEEIYQDAKAWLSGVSAKERGVWHDRFKRYVWEPNAVAPGYFNIMPQDGMLPCQCDKCKERAKVKGWEGRQVWQLTVDAANRLKKDGVKGDLTQMAYGHTLEIPEFDIPDNVRVMVAVYGPWTNGAKWQEQVKLVNNWSKKINGKVWLWTYVLKYSGRNILDVPCSTPRAIGKFYKDVKVNTCGSFMESSVDHSVFQFFNWYVFGKIMWNKDIDVNKLLADTYKAMYGAGADDMQKFFEKLEDIWLGQVTSKTVMTETGPVSVPPTDYELWNNIYSDEVMKKLEAMLAAAERKASGDKKCVARIRFIRDNYFGITKKARTDFFDRQGSMASMKKQITLAPDNTITVDGKLSEPFWKDAVTLYLGGLNGAPTEVRTKVKLARDSKNLYVAYECEEPEMARGQVDDSAVKFDGSGEWQHDSVEFFINPDGTRKNYMQWMVARTGNFTDLKWTIVDNRRTGDKSWNSDAVIKTAIQEKSWTMEAAIPLAKLGKIDENNIAAEFARNRIMQGTQKEQVFYIWSAHARRYHDYENFGLLSFNEVADNNILKSGNFEGVQINRYFGKVDKRGRAVGGWLTDAKLAKPNNDYIKLDNKTFLFEGQSLRIDNPKGMDMAAVQFFKLRKNTAYKLTFSIKSDDKKPGSGSAFVMLNYKGNHQYPVPPIRMSIPWTTYSYTFKTPADFDEARNCYLRLYSYKQTGTVWFDGVRIEEVKE